MVEATMYPAQNPTGMLLTHLCMLPSFLRPTFSWLGVNMDVSPEYMCLQFTKARLLHMEKGSS